MPTTPFLGQIIMFGGNFAIQNWVKCDGQLLAVSQNPALFGLIGTIYGGDGRTTFALPDLRGRVPVHQGDGPGLQSRAIGAEIGTEFVPLGPSQMPPHNHGFNADTLGALNKTPDNGLMATPGNDFLYGAGAPPDVFDTSAIGDSGSGNSHANVMPFQCVTFLICLLGAEP